MARRGLALLVFACGLLAAQPAGAATTLGTNPAAAAEGQVDCDPLCPGAIVQDTLNGAPVTAPNGVITSFAVQASGSVSLAVYRPTVRDATRLAASGVGSATVQGAGLGAVARATTRLPVKQGDVVGMKVPGGSAVYGISSATSRLFVAFAGGMNDTIDTTSAGTGLMLFSATVEPDADRDGYGDETQDKCPTNAFRTGACPKPRKLSLSRSVTVSSGRALLGIANGNDFSVKGSVSLKYGRRSAGKASFRLNSAAAKVVRVKLSKRARSRLAKKGAVKLSFKVVARGGGKTLTTTGKLTARKPKRRRRTGGGGGGGGGSGLDGAYERNAAADGPVIRFRVTGGGRRIENLTGAVVGTCFTLNGPQIQTISPAITSLPVAADGSFSGKEEVAGTTTEITNGKLANGKATGTVSVKTSACSAKADFTAERTGG